MLVRFFRWVRGWVLFEIKGPVSGFYSRCAKEGIVLWNMKAGEFPTACAGVSSYRKLRICARRSECRLRCKVKKGAPFHLKLFQKRRGLPAGIAAAICLVLYLSGGIWGIEVSGLATIQEEAFTEVCREAGLYPGVRKRELNVHRVQQRIMRAFPEISWLSVNTDGCQAHVVLAEGIEKPQMNDSEQIGNMKAAIAGQVIRIETFSGKTVVKVGDTVEAGQLLISGIVEKGAFPAVQAGGRIIARTNRVFTAAVPLREEVIYYTGEEIHRKSFSFFGITLPGSISILPRDGQWQCTGEDVFLRVNGSRLPLGWREEIWKNTVREMRQKSLQEAEQMLRRKIQEQQDALSCLKVVESNETLERAGDTLYLTVNARCEENIAIQSEIFVN